KTIAYVHDQVSRHSVLPVLACRDLVMGPKGQLGSAAPANAEERAIYESIIRERLMDSPAIALKVIDKDVKVRKVHRVGEENHFYVDARRLSTPKDLPPELKERRRDLDLDGKPIKVELMDTEAVD